MLNIKRTNMKKLLLSTIALLATGGAAMAQNGITVLPDANGLGLTSTAISANGRYIGGSDQSYGTFVYDREAGTMVSFESQDENYGASLYSISNTGMAVGCNGPACTFQNVDGEPVQTNYGESDEYLFYAISPNGKLIAGCTEDQTYNIHACYFEDGKPVMLPEPSSKYAGYGVSGAGVGYVTDDSLMVGFIVDDMASYPATAWYKNLDGSTFSNYLFSRPYFAGTEDSTKPYVLYSSYQSGVSSDGRYVALNVVAFDPATWAQTSGIARYDLETDSVVYFMLDGTHEDVPDVSDIMTTAVANDGTIVGAFGGVYYDRTAFIWKKGDATPKLLSAVYPGATKLTEYDSTGFHTPSGISADGRYITGFGYTEAIEETDETEGSESILQSYVLDTQDPAASVTPTGVSTAHVAKPAPTETARYSINGVMQKGVFSGINIIRMKNGKTVKRMVR